MSERELDTILGNNRSAEDSPFQSEGTITMVRTITITMLFFISVRPYYDHNMIMAIIGLKTLFSRNVNEIVVNKELGN